ncbi:MAG: oxygen-dependent coproporphyrinogen oxidase [Saprospiraceae bacterium]|nr:oxygen-dependent coproporphyrinogen oxidase [Saprospiraceae bacterium]
MSVSQVDRTTITSQFQRLQDSICNELERLDGGALFQEDPWQMESGGGGRTRILQGSHIEKGGVNYSAVSGPASDKLRALLQKEGDSFFASGVSIVLHPRNPYVPIIHMNIRYFEMEDETWWFGGGIDLTPHYIVPEEGGYFHRQLKKTCDIYDPTYYPKFKTWADDYFFLKHRNESRGIGGIFFDRLTGDGTTKEDLWRFTLSVGEAFAGIYAHLFEKNFEKSYTEEEKNWQLYRRGRYVEFNLVWDRGTRFGLETGGRTESILMSLPDQAAWKYGYVPSQNSKEAETQKWLRKGIDWLQF